MQGRNQLESPTSTSTSTTSASASSSVVSTTNASPHFTSHPLAPLPSQPHLRFPPSSPQFHHPPSHPRILHHHYPSHSAPAATLLFSPMISDARHSRRTNDNNNFGCIDTNHSNDLCLAATAAADRSTANRFFSAANTIDNPLEMHMPPPPARRPPNPNLNPLNTSNSSTININLNGLTQQLNLNYGLLESPADTYMSPNLYLCRAQESTPAITPRLRCNYVGSNSPDSISKAKATNADKKSDANPNPSAGGGQASVWARGTSSIVKNVDGNYNYDAEGMSMSPFAEAPWPRCQVDGCREDLNRAKKEYHRRHKVCEVHSKAAKVFTSGLLQRFCQQCSRFHAITEFDDTKRSCRRRLAGHNQRRRKSTTQRALPLLQPNDQCKRQRLSYNATALQPFAFLTNKSLRDDATGCSRSSSKRQMDHNNKSVDNMSHPTDVDHSRTARYPAASARAASDNLSAHVQLRRNEDVVAAENERSCYNNHLIRNDPFSTMGEGLTLSTVYANHTTSSRFSCSSRKIPVLQNLGSNVDDSSGGALSLLSSSNGRNLEVRSMPEISHHHHQQQLCLVGNRENTLNSAKFQISEVLPSITEHQESVANATASGRSRSSESKEFADDRVLIQNNNGRCGTGSMQHMHATSSHHYNQSVSFLATNNNNNVVLTSTTTTTNSNGNNCNNNNVGTKQPVFHANNGYHNVTAPTSLADYLSIDHFRQEMIHG